VRTICREGAPARAEAKAGRAVKAMDKMYKADRTRARA
jgi:hypothetical protein